MAIDKTFVAKPVTISMFKSRQSHYISKQRSLFHDYIMQIAGSNLFKNAFIFWSLLFILPA